MTYPRSPGRLYPRPLREIRCFRDCEAQYTGNPEDCHCAERDAILYDLEVERRIDAARNGDDREAGR